MSARSVRDVRGPGRRTRTTIAASSDVDVTALRGELERMQAQLDGYMQAVALMVGGAGGSDPTGGYAEAVAAQVARREARSRLRVIPGGVR